ncbi:MAG: ribokinase [Cyanobacteria bacterium P01_A01_bin.37]
MDVVVFGSINMDLVVRTLRLPSVGETIIGKEFEMLPGGKGANQAVAVARLGTSVAMIGRVGDDVFGSQLVNHLQAAGVMCDRISTAPGESSGVATIEVDAQGNNHIIVIPGANNLVDAEELAHLNACLAEAHIVLLQLEIPLSMVIAAATIAFEQGLTVILDPAPVHPELPDELLRHVSILTPNQVEASQLAGFPVETLADAHRAAELIQKKGPETVIVTLGDQGSLCVTSQGVIHMPCMPVEVVDTVAAGDAFNGGLATALVEGKSLRNSLRWATAVAAVAVSRKGAQSAMPKRSELHALFTL